MRSRAWLAGVTLLGSAVSGCLEPLPSEPTAMPELSPPSIDEAMLDCDFEQSRWTLAIDASSWAGDIASLWTVDEVYLERHNVPSVAYQQDGSGETFELTLRIVGDWREQSMGNTAYTCADDVSVIVAVKDLGGTLSDCRALGPDPERWDDVEGAPDNCPEPER